MTQEPDLMLPQHSSPFLTATSVYQIIQLINNHQRDNQSALLAHKREHTAHPNPFSYKRLDFDPVFALTQPVTPCPRQAGAPSATDLPPSSQTLAEVLARLSHLQRTAEHCLSAQA